MQCIVAGVDREVWQRVLGWLSGNDLAVTKEHTAVASDLDGVLWTPWNGEGSTVVVHHADSTLTLNRNVTVYGCRYEYGYGYGLKRQYVRVSIQVQLLA